MATAPPPDSAGQTAAALDQTAIAQLADTFGAMSPHSLFAAWLDWGTHLAASPGRQLALAGLAGRQAAALAAQAGRALSGGTAATDKATPDPRFADPDWQRWPFSLWRQSFEMAREWWDAATHDVRGVDPHHADLVAFAARQMLEACAPDHALATNPVAWRRTGEEHGANLARGALHLAEDLRRRAAGEPPAGADAFEVGRDVAATPGKVVLRTRLMELIQYGPTTDTVHPEPILLVPAWIMKYYILDLAPRHSLIRYLRDQGHTVFCISWKNPGEAERDLGMDDYLAQGPAAALDAIAAIVPGRRVHAAGYCLGGTLLAIQAAIMAREHDARLASVSLLAAQTDFSEPGEISLFIDESQVSRLEAQMARRGYLRADQMAGAFALLRSHELIWSRAVDTYLLGERQPLNDLMAWNADATRMPATMHAQYLRRLYLDNALARGRYAVRGQRVSLADIDLPIFCVGTEADHVAPWRSVYKLHDLCAAEITFVLTRGGHNAGIISEPGHPRRGYRLQARPRHGRTPDPAAWLDAAPQHEGSWWLAWRDWLAERSGTPVSPPDFGASQQGYPPLGDAPGTYVLERAQ